MGLCQRCQQRLATRQVTDLAGHAVQLCDQCSSGAFQLVPYTVLMPVVKQEMEPCPGCRSTLQRLSQSSHLGCPQCYRHFREPLRATLRRLHGSTGHCGRRPRQQLPAARAEELRQQLAQAIEECRFEDAAQLRDLLQRLKGDEA